MIWPRFRIDYTDDDGAQHHFSAPDFAHAHAIMVAHSNANPGCVVTISWRGRWLRYQTIALRQIGRGES